MDSTPQALPSVSKRENCTVVAVSGSVVASGGDDDTIPLYDLSAASSLGSLHQHSASITALSVYAPPNLSFPRNLISADAAGSLAIFDVDGFVHITTLSVHCNAAINDLALHQSCERALTVALTTASLSSTSSAAAATSACNSTRKLLWPSSMRPVTTFLWSRRRRVLSTILRMHAYCSNWNAPSPFSVLLLLGHCMDVFSLGRHRKILSVPIQILIVLSWIMSGFLGHLVKM
ncbi:uncharacterized protein LOC106752943 [Vigna radiata var. radiata]|uniref:Uncharacterized protein LOC106752943 n=1 Tax=Vigna radiata var. radiata TaxID=3916 RepID=A0A3Q0ERI8_VIGRR|nr:uncharacterized protein LOC106752943 [Vigna radiata var. radiata]